MNTTTLAVGLLFVIVIVAAVTIYLDHLVDKEDYDAKDK
jgi:hypothetical protein